MCDTDTHTGKTLMHIRKKALKILIEITRHCGLSTEEYFLKYTVKKNVRVLDIFAVSEAIMKSYLDPMNPLLSVKPY